MLEKVLEFFNWEHIYEISLSRRVLSLSIYLHLLSSVLQHSNMPCKCSHDKMDLLNRTLLRLHLQFPINIPGYYSVISNSALFHYWNHFFGVKTYLRSDLCFSNPNPPLPLLLVVLVFKNYSDCDLVSSNAKVTRHNKNQRMSWFLCCQTQL